MNKTTITLPDILFFSICLSSGCKPQEAPQSGQAAARLGKTKCGSPDPPPATPYLPPGALETYGWHSFPSL